MALAGADPADQPEQRPADPDDSAAEPAAADADDENTTEGPPQLRVVNLGDNWFELGTIRFNRATAEIVFPAEVNQHEDILEYLIVHEQGKTHEALLNTPISAAHLQAIMLLLRYPMSRDELEALLNRPSPDPLAEPWIPPSPTDEELAAFKASQVEFFIRTRDADEGESKEVPMFDWVVYKGEHRDSDLLMVFNGSAEFPAGFSAEMSGSIAANFFDRGAMFNLVHPDSWDDTVWFPKADIMPEIGSKVEVVIRRPQAKNADDATETSAQP